jgi:7-carboxy-7-deazaguanine synthase
MTNTQLPVMEHFYTLQGEGYNTGTASYFIRLAGCDVGCHWCDVKESWNANAHTYYTIDAIVKFVTDANAKNVVITGGEPCMHNLTELTTALKLHNCTICIETSGAYPLTGTIDWVCVSPKKFKAPLPQTLAKANELKVVVFNKHDFKWAEDNFKQCNPSCLGYLQPEWDKSAEINMSIVEYIKFNPQWKLSLQTHKYLNIP